MIEIVTKLLKHPEISPFWKESVLNLHVSNDVRGEIVRQLSGFEYDQDAEYVITIKRRKKKRTRDQNAYAWELIGKLSSALHIPPLEVYREIVRDMYTYIIVAVRKRNVKPLIEYWSQQGTTGWIAEDMGACFDIEDAHNVKLYYGSSKYDRKTMADFLDRIIEACIQQGIPTLTPTQLKVLEERRYDGMDKSVPRTA